MQYETGRPVRIGDCVVADGMSGTVVCDFERREFLNGFEDWDLSGVEMLGGDRLSSGIMIETMEAGLIHYEQGSGNIEFVRGGGR